MNGVYGGVGKFGRMKLFVGSCSDGDKRGRLSLISLEPRPQAQFRFDGDSNFNFSFKFFIWKPISRINTADSIPELDASDCFSTNCKPASIFLAEDLPASEQQGRVWCFYNGKRSSAYKWIRSRHYWWRNERSECCLSCCSQIGQSDRQQKDCHSRGKNLLWVTLTVCSYNSYSQASSSKRSTSMGL